MVDLSAITPIDSLSPDVAREHGLLGKVPALSCLSDPRFTYYLYAPTTYYSPTSPSPRLLVLIHQSMRNADGLREAFKTFAEKHNLFLLGPLFPIGFLDPNDTDNYKKIEYQGIRYDHVVLSMIEEVKARYAKVQSQTFGLYGFSGGGQFVHRFAYLHPERLWGLVVGAPGAQTRWDQTQDYPSGVRDLDRVFDGVNDEWEETLRAVPTAFMCGSEDTDLTWARLRGRAVEEGGRLTACKRLEQSWRMAGAEKTRFIEVPSAAHEESKLWPQVERFFAGLLAEADQQPAVNAEHVRQPKSLLSEKDSRIAVAVAPLTAVS